MKKIIGVVLVILLASTSEAGILKAAKTSGKAVGKSAVFVAHITKKVVKKIL